jgi:hypothetical protein
MGKDFTLTKYKLHLNPDFMTKFYGFNGILKLTPWKKHNQSYYIFQNYPLGAIEDKGEQFYKTN